MKKQNAFTLAELLVSILIISVILTLLAPVITKTINQILSVLKYQGLIILSNVFLLFHLVLKELMQ